MFKSSTQRMSFSHVIIALIVLLITIPAITHAEKHTIYSLPYTADKDFDTLILAGTKLTSSGNGIHITGNNIVLQLGNDTLVFGANGGDTNYGIYCDAWSHHIKIEGGTILHGSSQGNRNNCLLISRANDIYIDGTNMTINGINGHCIATPSVSPPGNYNIEINGGHYRSNVTGYTSRCNYDGAAICLGSTFKGYGDFHFKVHGLRLLDAPSQGMIVSGRTGDNDALVFVYACTLQADARNGLYDPDYGDETCHSAANPYQIIATYLEAGSQIHDNVITSGTQYGGCRGILLETCTGNISTPVSVYNNYVDVHEGVNLEDPEGTVQVIRVRFGNAHVKIYDNIFIGSAGQGIGSSYGRNAIVYRITATNEEGHNPDHHIAFERNIVKAIGLNSNSKVIAASIESFPGLRNVYSDNRFESSSEIINLGGSNYGASGICLKNDTLVRLSPSYNPVTVNVGWRNYFTASNDTLWDCVYLGGASENGITIEEYNSDIYLFSSLKVKLLGNNELPVQSSDVTVYNNYGNVAYSGSTDCSGEIETGVAYKFISGHSADSLNYNNFNVTGSKDGDFTNRSISISQPNTSIDLVLSGTTGEIAGDGIEFTVVDIVNLINYIFYSQPQPQWERSDVDTDGEINVRDITLLVNYVFKGGAHPSCL